MIVIGVDAHKRTHTCAAVQELTGRELQTRTVPARDDGSRTVARLGTRRCEQAGVGDRGLPARVRTARAVPARSRRKGHPHAAEAEAGARKSSRERGKSDPIDAVSVARGAIREGIEACRPRSSTNRRSMFASSSTIASGLFTSAPR